MQNPKKQLEQGGLYHVANKVALRSSHHGHSSVLERIEPGSIVMFLNYHPSSVRICKVAFRELVGWIVVAPHYLKHHYFFRKVSEKPK